MSMVIDGSNGLTYPNSSTQASAGVVLQVVQGTYSTQTSNSTNVFADTGLSATITPQFSTSQILVIVHHTDNEKSSANSSNDIGFNICRNGTNIQNWGSGNGYTGTALTLDFSSSVTYLDSPASTSALTYKTQFRNYDANAATVSVQVNGSIATITLMEIAA